METSDSRHPQPTPRSRLKLLHTLIFALLFTFIGFFIGDRSWSRLELFKPTVVVDSDFNPEYFGLQSRPEFSSGHFFYRTGVMDVTEFWSFSLPENFAREFLDFYVAEKTLRRVDDDNAPPPYLDQLIEDQSLAEKYWFRGIGSLDEAWTGENLLCGYSASDNRIYMMNWNR